MSSLFLNSVASKKFEIGDFGIIIYFITLASFLEGKAITYL